MFTPLQAFLTSAFVLIVILIVFRIERSRGKRFLGGLRSHIDFWLLKVRHMFNVRLRNWSRYFLRQIGHYFLHTFLTGAIASLSMTEEKLRTIARSNRVLAKRSDRERTQKNKLEEVALHKLEVALTEEEKRIRKRRSLEGS
jgi:hypothetical protein